MATRLKQLLTFTNIGAGGVSTQSHSLNWEGLAVKPDEVKQSTAGFTVTATATAVTVTNTTSGALSVILLLESWHSIERAFGAQTTLALGTQPFVAATGTGLPGLDPTGPNIAALIGPTLADQHTIPAVAADTFALLGASQVLSAKTIASGLATTSFSPASDLGATLGTSSTNRWAQLFVEQVFSRFTGLGTAATPTPGYQASNDLAATALSPAQWSPGMIFNGRAWDGANSISNDWGIQGRPANGAVQSTLFFGHRFGASAYVQTLGLVENQVVATQGGTLALPGFCLTDLTSGWYRIAANVWGFSTNTAQAARVGEGYWYLSAPNAAPTDGNLFAGSIVWYLAQGSNQLKARILYADGVTYKDLTTPLALT